MWEILGSARFSEKKISGLSNQWLFYGYNGYKISNESKLNGYNGYKQWFIITMEKSPPSSGILQAGNKSGIHRLPRNAGLLISHRIHGAAIYGNIYHQYTFNVSICIIHGSYGFYLMIDIRTDPLIIGEVGVRTAPRWLVPWDLWRFLFCAPWFSPHADGNGKCEKGYRKPCL